jgi:hypothetical protein
MHAKVLKNIKVQKELHAIHVKEKVLKETHYFIKKQSVILVMVMVN